jgi:hypothetical protein
MLLGALHLLLHGALAVPRVAAGALGGQLGVLEVHLELLEGLVQAVRRGALGLLHHDVQLLDLELLRLDGILRLAHLARDGVRLVLVLQRVLLELRRQVRDGQLLLLQRQLQLPDRAQVLLVLRRLHLRPRLRLVDAAPRLPERVLQRGALPVQHALELQVQVVGRLLVPAAPIGLALELGVGDHQLVDLAVLRVHQGLELKGAGVSEAGVSEASKTRRRRCGAAAARYLREQ